MDFDRSHYVPILKGKQGELTALKNISSNLRGYFTPLLEVPPIPPKYIEGQEEPNQSKSIDDHVAHVAEKFGVALASIPSVFVDGVYLETENDLSNGTSPIAAIFAILRKQKINFIPTVGLDRLEDYVESVREAVKIDGNGCCLRLLESDLEGIVDLSGQITSLLEVLRLKAKQVDLLLDFGPRVPSRAALPYQIDALPMVKQWRTFTIAASSFPVDMSGIAQNLIRDLEREEWIVWLSLRVRQRNIARMPTYGDYAINHPVLSEIDPRIINMSPNIRYTAGSNYVIAKGQAIPRKKKNPTRAEEEARKKLLPTEQYPKLAAKIMGHPNWRGPSFSWGDNLIESCSRRDFVGNATDWRAIGTCHHIAEVVQQLANLPELV